MNNNIILESNNYKNDIKNVLDKIFKLFQKNVKEIVLSFKKEKLLRKISYKF